MYNNLQKGKIKKILWFSSYLEREAFSISGVEEENYCVFI